MSSDTEYPVIRVGHPIVGILASFPIACFTCALLTDIAYARTMDVMWADFSTWLLAVGMIGGVMAALAGLVGWIAGRIGRARRSAWIVALLSLLTLMIAFVDNLVHSRDAWTSVMPLGLALSAVTVVVMLVTAWLGYGASYRAATAYPGARP